MSPALKGNVIKLGFFIAIVETQSQAFAQICVATNP